jgi:hypothetical protein
MDRVRMCKRCGKQFTLGPKQSFKTVQCPACRAETDKHREATKVDNIVNRGLKGGFPKPPKLRW